jgi:long-chain acyl-CoA synthetase
MLSHGNFAAIAASFQHDKDLMLPPGSRHISYLPLPHVMERAACILMMSAVGTICFYGGDVQALKNDLPLVRPDIFPSVPRLFCRFYDVIKGRFDSLTGFQKQLVDRAIATKLDRLHRYGTCTHTFYDQLVFNKTREAFGGRVRFMVTGSAPIAGYIIDFLKIISCCPLI